MNVLLVLVIFAVFGLVIYLEFKKYKAEKAEAEKAAREAVRAYLVDAYRILCEEEPYKSVPFLRLFVLLQTFQLGLRDESEMFVGDVMTEVLTDSKREEKLCELVEVSRQLYENGDLSEIDSGKLKELKDFLCSWLDGLRATE